MWERTVENRVIRQGPLHSGFPLLLVGQAWGSVGWMCVRIEGRLNSLWEVAGWLVTILWTSDVRRLG